MKRKNNSFQLELPQAGNSKDIKKDIKQKDDHIEKWKNIVKIQYNEVYKYIDIVVNDTNLKEIEALILASQDLLDNSIKDTKYSGNKDQNFVNLLFLVQKLSLRIETYKLDTKLEEIRKSSNALEKNQKRLEERNNNLVFNILGFIASFSIISASVGAIEEIENTTDVILFMVFTAFILITTLIALHNFYGNEKDDKNILKNNYFLWKAMVYVIVGLLAIKGVDYIDKNKELISENIGKGIGQIINQTNNIENNSTSEEKDAN